MKHLFASMITMLGLLACATPPVTDPVALESGNYTLDPTHARVNWALSHAGLSQYTARFDTVSGTLNFDANNPEASRLDVRIDPKSVSTGLRDFDETLSMGGKYFNAQKYPEIRFVSTQVAKTSETSGVIIGDLTLRGVTKPVTLDVTFNGAGKSYGHPGKTLGFSATGNFLRSDFGMDTLIALAGIGDKITLRLEAEFNETQ